MTTKWLQERVNGSKNEVGMVFEGPCVAGADPTEREREARERETTDYEPCAPQAPIHWAI